MSARDEQPSQETQRQLNGSPEVHEGSDDEERASWGDWDSQVSDTVIPGIFSGESTKLEDIWEQCRQDSGFDWYEYRRNHTLTEYDFIRLVNFLRRHAPSCRTREGREQLVAEIQPSASFWSDDHYLTPALVEDPLIQRFQEEIESDEDDAEEKEEELQGVTERMKNAMREQASGITPEERVDAEEGFDADEGYFGSYGNTEIHAEMIWDKARTLSYKRAIDRLRPVFHDKVVLDVGCGTGILSMFCARAGAKHVYGVEATNIADEARVSVAANNLTDKITIYKSKAEQLQLPVDQVDVIVSEWMGYGLLFENMLPSVLYCRDKWLKKEGFMLPDLCGIYMEGITDKKVYEDKVACWDNVFGLGMPSMRRRALDEAHVMKIDHASVGTTREIVFAFDTRTVDPNELDVFQQVSLCCDKVSTLYGIVISFDCGFSNNVVGPYKSQHLGKLETMQEVDNTLQTFQRNVMEENNSEITEPNVLSTSCQDVETHWKQVALFFSQPIDTSSYDKIEGQLLMHRVAETKRSYQIRLHLDVPKGFDFSWTLE